MGKIFPHIYTHTYTHTHTPVICSVYGFCSKTIVI